MARERVHSVLSGETITFRHRSDPSDGELVEFDLELRPLGVPGALPHRHLPAERFEVLSGALLAYVHGRGPIHAGPGDVIEVPSRTWHVVIALRRSRALVIVRPGMHFDELLACGAAVGSGDLRPATLLRFGRLMREHGYLP